VAFKPKSEMTPKVTARRKSIVVRVVSPKRAFFASIIKAAALIGNKMNRTWLLDSSLVAATCILI